MDNSPYNGWSNYPTWTVNLWLSNDEDLYAQTTDLVTGEMDSNPDDHVYRVGIADTLKDWVTDELAPDLGATFAADLLGYALSEVDWFELADAWIESAKDASAV